ncbi:LURP-one-related/scramblase family protein [Saccharibacillus alkalitolerans]|uniref:LURP-one-related family protein n=1 Tax=Saccharibacillus alkalitolerans TaxID=2705290 RepID=A0ABX0FAU6_9BACL|nr:hypothetical protein [Saccharibacillus alkalitolerans]NGZ75147.1 hypothetical protein [Saccharibacillus alkalitolerans]
MELYFSDNFFGMGETEIMNEAGEAAGTLDLRSAFGSSLDVYARSGELLYTGKFRMMMNRWRVLDANDTEVGMLRPRFTLFSKKFEYDAGERGVYEIESPNFSKEYSITENGTEVATFAKTNGWLRSDAYVLNNRSRLDDYELVAVVMGVNAIRKRQQSAANSAGR